MSLSAFSCSLGGLLANVFEEHNQKLFMLCRLTTCFTPTLPTPFHDILLTAKLCLVANTGNTSLSAYDASNRMLANPIILGR